MALLDNYKLETRQQEELTATELNEESDFLEAILKTDVMKIASEFLIEEGKIKDMSELKSLLSDIWFTFYSRTANSK
jgi:poly(U)-specific endoribonuclease